MRRCHSARWRQDEDIRGSHCRVPIIINARSLGRVQLWQRGALRRCGDNAIRILCKNQHVDLLTVDAGSAGSAFEMMQQGRRTAKARLAGRMRNTGQVTQGPVDEGVQMLL